MLPFVSLHFILSKLLKNASATDIKRFVTTKQAKDVNKLYFENIYKRAEMHLPEAVLYIL